MEIMIRILRISWIQNIRNDIVLCVYTASIDNDEQGGETRWTKEKSWLRNIRV